MTTGEFFAMRGGRSLAEEEFRAHLALCVRLENVAVLLGAGASVGAGGHTMDRLWREFKAAYAGGVNWLQDAGFLPPGDTSGVNVESLLDSLELAEIEWRRSGDTRRLDLLCQHRADLRRCVLRAALLDETLWAEPEKAGDALGLRDHVLMLARLVANRQPGQAAPWIFTTNYDLSVEWAAEVIGLQLLTGFSGLHVRRFQPSCYDLAFRHATARGEARFGTYHAYLGKLHGSLSWRILSDGAVAEVASPAQFAALKHFLEGGPGAEWPSILIFPGAAKFVQTTGFVYGEVVRRLMEFVSRPNCSLIVSGYGFNDDHLNRILLSALQNPTAQIIVYLPELAERTRLPNADAPTRPLPPGHALTRLLELKLPQVTVVGGGSRAYFTEMVADLPEAALLDEMAAGARSIQRLVQQLEGRRTPEITGSPSNDIP